MSRVSKQLLSLDVGERRIGVAVADTAIRIPVALETIEVDGSELTAIAKIVTLDSIDTIVVGYPRNQSGEPTAQTTYVLQFAQQLKDMAPVVFQDESLTSVIAEQQLKADKRPYTKGDIDARAATLILQDYLEIHHAA
ncbi:TPA: Holliday junction resolvase RuvX [Candidatus Saccharibacteria bacterium]|nr:MAG: putative Holliday junction resolvase [Candidatus Saccharibacteria bacterium GW2011_GWC2_44_17]OGL23676.1 MAG: Holliday junction resolvase [Candidatus Saccharibacteria bacterium RIFCSPHIGHO2_01_FULL_46_30]OGL33322.1 MAG: Holliday junction resolvase [Candidatus Saccharibacteria bacterium RIFCSPHIGHO2_12_FULL_47_16]HBH77706.1 Holliday junction resolvase RuvX [Candidatus Saccharibacteria bacterium]